MTITLEQIQTIVSAVEDFPLADVETALVNPNVSTTEQVLVDALGIISAAYPQAEVAAIAFEAIVWAIRNPAVNADTNKDPLGRGGRRS